MARVDYLSCIILAVILEQYDHVRSGIVRICGNGGCAGGKAEVVGG
jgi:hypothetical protein